MKRLLFLLLFPMLLFAQTRNIVPRAAGQGGIGTFAKPWATSYFDTVNVLGPLFGNGPINIGSYSITSGLINGQEIDATANFTGTATIGGKLIVNSSGSTFRADAGAGLFIDDPTGLYNITVNFSRGGTGFERWAFGTVLNGTADDFRIYNYQTAQVSLLIDHATNQVSLVGNLSVNGTGTNTFGGNLAINGTSYNTFAAGTAPTTSVAGKTKVWVQNVNGVSGTASLFERTEDANSATDAENQQVIVSAIIKSSTGDPTYGHEGLLCINTFDHTVKIYAGGGWRTFVSTW